MKRVFYLFLVVAFASVSFTACKKYEDGPALSLRSKAERVANEWQLQKVTNNEVDVTDTYEDDFLWTFTKDGDYIKFENAVSENGTWEFNEEKTELILQEENSPEPRFYGILMLKEKEMTIQETVNTSTTTFYLVAKE